MRLTIFLSLIAVIILGAGFFWIKNLMAQNDSLKADIQALRNQEPKEIIVTKDNVKIEYVDREVIKYRAPEGSVTIDIQKYKESIERINYLEKRMDALLNHLYTLESDGFTDKEKIDDLKEEITSLQEEIKREKSRDVIEFVDIKNFGLTLSPMLSYGLTGKDKEIILTPSFNMKLLYYKRWSLGLLGSKYVLGPSISRRIDDIIPFFDNSSFIASMNYNFKNVYLGIGVDL